MASTPTAKIAKFIIESPELFNHFLLRRSDYSLLVETFELVLGIDIMFSTANSVLL